MTKLSEGLHDLTVKCPDCGRLTMFPVEITTRLIVDSGNGGRLSPKFSTKSVEHSCDDADPDEDDDDFERITDVHLPA